MTVRELIGQLQKFDADIKVCRRNVDYGSEERHESDDAVDIETVMGPGNYLATESVVLS